MTAAGPFGSLLREFREQRRIAQARLAVASGFDHSYVSRLESGTRSPTRGAVYKLSAALALEDVRRDSLLRAAGFATVDPLHMLDAEPVVAAMAEFLMDESVPAELRDEVRGAVHSIAKLAHSMARHSRTTEVALRLKVE